MNKKLLDQIWESNKEKINGYWYVKLSDVNELIANTQFKNKKEAKKMTKEELRCEYSGLLSPQAYIKNK
jgi:hypothetical protein